MALNKRSQSSVLVETLRHAETVQHFRGDIDGEDAARTANGGQWAA